MIFGVVLVFVIGVLPYSMFLDALARERYDTARRSLVSPFGVVAKITAASVFSGLLAMSYSFFIVGDLLFSLTFLLIFLGLLIVDFILIARADRAGWRGE